MSVLKPWFSICVCDNQKWISRRYTITSLSAKQCKSQVTRLWLLTVENSGALLSDAFLLWSLLAQITSLAFWLARHWKWCWKWTGGTGYWYTNDKLALLEVSTSITCPQQVARDFYGTFLVPTERQKAFLSQCAFSMAHALPMIQIDSFL